MSNLKNLTANAIEFIGFSKNLTHLEKVTLDGCDKIDKHSLLNILNHTNFFNLKVLKFD